MLVRSIARVIGPTPPVAPLTFAGDRVNAGMHVAEDALASFA